MNKQEILEEINKTEEHLADMKKMLKECEYKRWKPEKGEKYWWVGGSSLNIMTSDRISPFHYLTYNCFKTKEEAEQEAEKILVRRQLEDIARRLNKDEKIDWNNQECVKHCLTYDNKYKCICQAANKFIVRQGTVYCLDENFKDIATQEIGKERLTKYLRGE